MAGIPTIPTRLWPSYAEIVDFPDGQKAGSPIRLRTLNSRRIRRFWSFLNGIRSPSVGFSTSIEWKLFHVPEDLSR